MLIYVIHAGLGIQLRNGPNVYAKNSSNKVQGSWQNLLPPGKNTDIFYFMLFSPPAFCELRQTFRSTEVLSAIKLDLNGPLECLCYPINWENLQPLLEMIM